MGAAGSHWSSEGCIQGIIGSLSPVCLGQGECSLPPGREVEVTVGEGGRELEREDWCGSWGGEGRRGEEGMRSLANVTI